MRCSFLWGRERGWMTIENMLDWLLLKTLRDLIRVADPVRNRARSGWGIGNDGGPKDLIQGELGKKGVNDKSSWGYHLLSVDLAQYIYLYLIMQVRYSHFAYEETKTQEVLTYPRYTTLKWWIKRWKRSQESVLKHCYSRKLGHCRASNVLRRRIMIKKIFKPHFLNWSSAARWSIYNWCDANADYT